MEERTKTCCEVRTKKRTEDEKKALIHRLNRIEGQIRGIRGMIENDAYCTDVLTQSAAVTAAVNAFNATTARIGLESPIVICQKSTHSFAPSNCALSYSSCGSESKKPFSRKIE